MTALAPSTWWRGLGGLTRSGSAVEGFSWALYDFANTIYSFAIVSFAIGPWAVRFLGETNGKSSGAFFYSDPISTAIAVMSLFAINAIGFKESEARYVLIGLTVVAVLASFGWGVLVDRIGPKRTLLIVLGSWVVGLLLLGLVLAKIPFLIAGAILGSGLGGVAVTDRIYLLRLSRAEETGEMFGLYGLAGKLSAVIGPLLFGGILVLDPARTGPGAYQVAILSLLLLMIIGLVIMLGVPESNDDDDQPGLPVRVFPPELVAPLETGA